MEIFRLSLLSNSLSLCSVFLHDFRYEFFFLQSVLNKLRIQRIILFFCKKKSPHFCTTCKIILLAKSYKSFLSQFTFLDKCFSNSSSFTKFFDFIFRKSRNLICNHDFL